jgi:hypothetical protein
MNALLFYQVCTKKQKEIWMKTQTVRIDPNDDVKETKTHTDNLLQEQFIRQVKDDSLPANQVLTQQNDSSKNEDRGTGDSAPLFVP